MQDPGSAGTEPPAANTNLEKGRLATRELRWADAYSALLAADADLGLAADDLELLAAAAVLLGDTDACIHALQRAHQQFVDGGDFRRAVRSGFWVGFHFFGQGEFSQGGGWLARISRLCEQVEPDAAEHGYPLVGTAYNQIRVQGSYAEGELTARRALEFAHRYGDPDLLGLAQVLLGGALIRQERSIEGLAILDETMIGVLAGETSAVVSGTIYCATIKDCEEIFDYRRVREWTQALTKWCDRQSAMVTFAGECHVHRATIKQLTGAWPEAVEEVELATQQAPLGADRYVMGLALYRQAELHRVRGRLDDAENAYERAAEWGADPQPGLALMRVAQGKTEAALSGVRRALGELSERSRRAKLLPAMVEIAIAAGEMEQAEKASQELAEIAAVFGTPALAAESNQARGLLLLAEGRASEAITLLRDAEQEWMSLGFPHNEAQARVLIGQACRAMGDEETAGIEMETANAIMARLGAHPIEPKAVEHGLTSRELEVLQLIASGMTNQAIADQLFLSVKTVDRHVSNIFTKIGVPSRSAATAFAFRNGLISPG